MEIRIGEEDTGLDAKKYGEMLRDFREAAGLTQEELAGKLYVSRTLVSRWESGSREPDPAMKENLREVLGIVDTDAGEEPTGEKKKAASGNEVSGKNGILRSVIAFLLGVLIALAAVGTVNAVEKKKEEREALDLFVSLSEECVRTIDGYLETGEEKRLGYLNSVLTEMYGYTVLKRDALGTDKFTSVCVIRDYLIASPEKVRPYLPELKSVLWEFTENRSLSWLETMLLRVANHITA